ncbi:MULTISPECIES: hypothetical protein [unclassified Nitratiruptor]|uniref:hypothetical protein n=1 Tax=unclassified Nitratiruptor TaxID=2624044 RepID=UPI0019168BAC|nr:MULTISPECIES: hypothetical protein [unclassified Nitratiruptor]BCD59787.1 hypothetical protein NitYY0810_C0544 [Nitratiruptor sp. YY08-10]BCD63711.1 hypothetical protein NitYY0814_C0544 [Nitratiruptor sp. YY08-14]
MADIYKHVIEHSLNPFFIFNSEGDLIDFNNEGEYLLSFLDKEEIFQVAIENATHFPGFKNTYIDLSLPQMSFCAISVGYIDDENICIQFQKHVCKKYFTINDKLQSANIFTLIDVALNANMIDETKLVREYDISIPEFKLDIDHFLKMLNKILKSCKESQKILIKVMYATGRHIKIENKKFSVVAIDIVAKDTDLTKVDVQSEEFLIDRIKNGIHIELPLIL